MRGAGTLSSRAHARKGRHVRDPVACLQGNPMSIATPPPASGMHAVPMLPPLPPHPPAVRSVAVSPDATAMPSRLADPSGKAQAAAPTEVVDRLNARLQAWATHLQFRIDETADRVVIQVVDVRSGDVVRQIPSEDAICMARVAGRLQDLALRTQA